MKIQQEGIESMGHAHALKMEIANTSALLEDRAVLLDQQERQLSEVQCYNLSIFLARMNWRTLLGLIFILKGGRTMHSDLLWITSCTLYRITL